MSLPRSLILEGLEDNVDQHVLHEVLTKIGLTSIEDFTVYNYSSKIPKSLGIAKVCFTSHSATKIAFRKLQRTRILGNALKLHLDPSGLSYDIERI